jgi:sulfur transfer protein SufE
MTSRQEIDLKSLRHDINKIVDNIELRANLEKKYKEVIETGDKYLLYDLDRR